MSLAEYIVLERRMFEERRLHPEGSTREDNILDEMDVVWYGLTDEEHEQLERCPRCDGRGVPIGKSLMGGPGELPCSTCCGSGKRTLPNKGSNVPQPR